MGKLAKFAWQWTRHDWVPLAVAGGLLLITTTGTNNRKLSELLKRYENSTERKNKVCGNNGGADVSVELSWLVDIILDSTRVSLIMRSELLSIYWYTRELLTEVVRVKQRIWHNVSRTCQRHNKTHKALVISCFPLLWSVLVNENDFRLRVDPSWLHHCFLRELLFPALVGER